MQHSKFSNLEELTVKIVHVCTFFALRALPRNFIPFIIAYLSWNWNTPLMIPDIALITTKHPLPFLRHSTFAVDFNCDFNEFSLLSAA